MNNFLSVNYGSIGFLVNRNQFYSSCYIENETQIESSVPYVDNMITYGDKSILVFNLHKALQELFHIDDESNARLLLVINSDTLSESITEKFGRIQGPENEINHKLIGLQIKSDARVESLPIEDLCLLPISIRSFLKQYGVIACSFPTSERIHYFIEVDSIFSTCINTTPHTREGI